MARSETNNCSIVELSEYNIKTGAGKELVALQNFDCVNTVKIQINPEYVIILTSNFATFLQLVLSESDCID